jgi:hypothetical protein
MAAPIHSTRALRVADFTDDFGDGGRAYARLMQVRRAFERYIIIAFAISLEY